MINASNWSKNNGRVLKAASTSCVNTFRTFLKIVEARDNKVGGKRFGAAAGVRRIGGVVDFEFEFEVCFGAECEVGGVAFGVVEEEVTGTAFAERAVLGREWESSTP